MANDKNRATKKRRPRNVQPNSYGTGHYPEQESTDANQYGTGIHWESSGWTQSSSYDVNQNASSFS